MIRHLAVVLLALFTLVQGSARAQNCTAPELICKASANQDRSLYFRDHCRYEQKIHIERFRVAGIHIPFPQREIRLLPGSDLKSVA